MIEFDNERLPIKFFTRVVIAELKDDEDFMRPYVVLLNKYKKCCTSRMARSEGITYICVVIVHETTTQRA